MDPMDTNESLEDIFMYSIEGIIETGDAKQLRILINCYKNKINKTYIQIAENLYYELVKEQFEEISL